MQKLLIQAALLGCLLGGVAPAQQPVFGTRVSYPNSFAFQGFLGDFNGDSIPDFAIPGITNPGLVTFFGNGNGTFTQGPSSPLSDSDFVQVAQTVDINGDGRLDLVYMPENARTILVRLGNGDGTFRDAIAVPVINDALGFSLADVNGDGKLDAVVITYHNYLKVAFGKGDGTFNTPVETPVASPIAIGAADLNGDGKADVLLTTSTATSVLIGHGDGTFSPSQSFSIGCYDFGTARSADLNGDGLPDFALGCYGSAKKQTPFVATFINAGAGVMHVGSLIQVNGVVQDIEIGDMNGDGRLDVVAAGGLGNVFILLGKGNGGLFDPYSYQGDASTTWVGLADLRKSGALDMILMNSAAYDWSVLLNNGKGRFADGVSVATTAPQYWAVPTDFNRDGIVDLAVASGAGIQVYYGTGKTYVPFVAGPVIPTGASPQAVVAGDLNNDGYPDVMAIYEKIRSITYFVEIYLGSPGGTFTHTATYQAGPANRFVGPGLLGDLNHDGKPDLITTGGVMLGNGDGTFQAFVPFATPTVCCLTQGYTNPPAIGDFNGDGNLDVATFQDSPGNLDSSLVILLGKGDGTFQAPVTTSYLGNALSVGDFNKDGVADLVIGQTYEGFQLLLGDGRGGFNQSTDINLNFFSQFVASTIGDFNGDGNLDVAVANNKFYVTVVLGNGDGTFSNAANPLTLGTGPYPTCIVAGKFHSNGSHRYQDLLTVTGDLTLLPNFTPH